jgi:hypothetical protein
MSVKTATQHDRPPTAFELAFEEAEKNKKDKKVDDRNTGKGKGSSSS